MTLDASDALPFGPLVRTEVYFDLDGPRLFALRSEDFNTRVIAICIDEDDDAETVTYLYVALSTIRFRHVRGGRVSLRRAIDEAAPSELWKIEEHYADRVPYVTALEVSASDLAEQDLPHPDARLEIPTPTVAPLDRSELSETASESLRTVGALELQTEEDNLTEFPLRGLGQVSAALQNAIDAFAQEVRGTPTDRGAIPASITREVQMSALDLRAASFAVVFGTKTSGTLMEDTELIQRALKGLVELISEGADTQALLERMRGHGRRARGRFKDLLEAADNANSGLGLVVAPASEPLFEGSMSRDQVFKALKAVSSVKPSTSDIDVNRGLLLGSNTRRSTFEILDLATSNRYTGKVSDEAKSEIDGLRVGQNGYIIAVVREEVDFGEDESLGGNRHTLLSIRERVEQMPSDSDDPRE